MESHVSRRLRSDAMKILRGALNDCSPYRLLFSQLSYEGGTLRGPDFRIRIDPRKMIILGMGKAAGSMARALLDLMLAKHFDALIVVAERATKDERLGRILQGAHPVPDARSFRAGSALLRRVQSAGAGDLVIHLISGGASALAAAPLTPLLTRREKSLLHRLLVRSALGIREMNVVRKHFSALKGGRLLAHAPRARHLSLLLSDVPVDCPEAIGSGPTLPDPSNWSECLEILKRSGIRGELPRALVARIDGRSWPETPKPGDPVFSKQAWSVLGDSTTLVDAARRHARAMGYATRVLRGSVEEDADSLLEVFSRTREKWTASASMPRCLIAGGEVRLETLAARGRGGRAQDLAAAASVRMHGSRSCLFLAAGSDGRDGNSPAAGAMADGRTLARARRKGLHLEMLRRERNTFELFRRLGDSVITGPTQNNLRDLYLMLEAGKG